MPKGLKALRIYWSYWKKRPWQAAGSFLSGPAFVLQNIVSTFFIAKIVGELTVGQSLNYNYIFFAAASYFSGAILWFISDRYISVPFLLRTMEDMHNDCLEHLMKQEYGFFADNFVGSLVNKATRFVRSYEIIHSAIFLEALGQLCGVLIALAIMMYYSPLLGLLITLIWIMSIVAVSYMAIKRMPVRRAAVAKESQQTGELADTLTNAVTAKTFATEKLELARYNETNRERARRYRISWRLATRNNLLIQVMCGILLITALLGGVQAVTAGNITLATFVLFQVYIVRIIDSIGKASLFVRHLEGAFGDAHEMTELFEREPGVLDSVRPEKSRIMNGKVNFNQVNFGYKEHYKDEPLFKDLNLSVAAGEHVGLVGPSGGGKTTITRLLLRFHDIDTGTISIDGQNIATIKQTDLHRAIAYVPQEPILFHRSLAENIAYGSPSLSHAQIESAARRAHAHDFIKMLPDGYNTLVGERGIKLSGGQRQRIVIARAMLKDAPILLLDEATSALDSESEKLIQEALWELMKERTAIVIAHRLSTIQKMDRIIVLNEGRIVEKGTHKELLTKNGMYATLWKHQSGGFLED